MVEIVLLKSLRRSLENAGSARLPVSSQPRNILITNVVAIPIPPKGYLVTRTRPEAVSAFVQTASISE